MKLKLPFCGWLGGVVLFGAGCTFPSSKTLVPAAQAGQLQSSDTGSVVKVREVAIDGRRTNLGQYSGAVIGGAAALPSGGRVTSKGQALAVTGASVVGAVGGEAVEEYITRKAALEITIQMKDGHIVTIVQATPPAIMVGDTVQVIHSPAGARVAMSMD